MEKAKSTIFEFDATQKMESGLEIIRLSDDWGYIPGEISEKRKKEFLRSVGEAIACAKEGKELGSLGAPTCVSAIKDGNKYIFGIDYFDLDLRHHQYVVAAEILTEVEIV